MKKHKSIPCNSKTTQQMYIYEEEGHWYAYGDCAQFMRKLQEECVEMRLIVSNTQDVVADKVKVKFETIVENFKIVLCSDTEIILEYPN